MLTGTRLLILLLRRRRCWIGLRQIQHIEIHCHPPPPDGFGLHEKASYRGNGCAPDLLAFSNGDLQALLDRSDGFYRRQLVLTTKENRLAVWMIPAWPRR